MGEGGGLDFSEGWGDGSAEGWVGGTGAFGLDYPAISASWNVG